MAISWLINKQTVVNPCFGILLNNRKEKTADNMQQHKKSKHKRPHTI